jgi:NADH:ubiquinone oxidoreductase subunit 2 (subunit N)
MPIPEAPVILLASASFFLLCGRLIPARLTWTMGLIFLTVCLVSNGYLFFQPIHSTGVAEGARQPLVWKNDGFALASQSIVLWSGVFVGGILFDFAIKHRNTARVYGFLLFALAGLMFMVSANDLVAFGLAVEIVDLSLGALQKGLLLAPFRAGDPSRTSDFEKAESGERCEVGRSPHNVGEKCEVGRPSHNVGRRPHNGSSDATLASDSGKIESLGTSFGRLRSALMWLGIAFLANASATTNFDELQSALIEWYHPGGELVIGTPSKLILLAAGLISFSLFMQLGLFPLQTGYSATVRGCPKWIFVIPLLISQLTGALGVARLFGDVFASLGPSLAVLVTVVTLATFVFAAVVALRARTAGSKSLRDLLVSLLLLQSGWIVVITMVIALELDHPGLRWGAFAGQPETVSILLMSLVTTMLVNCGVVGALGHLERSDRPIEFLEEFKGLGQYALLPSLALTVCLASAAACPWTAGFWSRWSILLSGNNVHLKTTSTILSPHQGIRVAMAMGVAATLALAALIVRIVREMFFESPLTRPVATGGRSPLVVSFIAATAILVLGIVPQLVVLPLGIIQSPRTVNPKSLERGSGKNSMGLNDLRDESSPFRSASIQNSSSSSNSSPSSDDANSPRAPASRMARPAAMVRSSGARGSSLISSSQQQ